jgi:hypothetical protein
MRDATNVAVRRFSSGIGPGTLFGIRSVKTLMRLRLRLSFSFAIGRLAASD